MNCETINIYRGRIINPISSTQADILENGCICVKGSKILDIGSFNELEKKYQNSNVLGNSDDFLLPGMIDLHNHLPQFGAIAIGKGELLDWLNNYIFPEERKFANKKFAEKISEIFFKEIISYGTTCSVIFSSVYKDATDIAFQMADKYRVKSFIGKCMMDSNSPDYMLSPSYKNINDSMELFYKWHNYDQGRLKYILSPRYAGSCSIELMHKISKISIENDIFIQSHIAENQNELKYISKLFPESNSYVDIYDKAGMLSEKTLLAHSIYLDDDEIELLNIRKVNVVHCPSSNRFLNSGIMQFKQLKSKGLKIGLGTDIAAGTSLSMFNEMKEAIESSKSIDGYGTPGVNTITGTEALYTATLCAAEILGIDFETGNLKVGKDADFIILANSFTPEFASDEEFIKYIIYYYSNKKVKKNYVRGNEIYSSI